MGSQFNWLVLCLRKNLADAACGWVVLPVAAVSIPVMLFITRVFRAMMMALVAATGTATRRGLPEMHRPCADDLSNVECQDGDGE